MAARQEEVTAKIAQLIEALRDFPGTWDAREAILAMKDADYAHWKQMEWIGFYFQFLCERVFANLLTMPGETYGRTQFDAFGPIPWDFKAHSMKMSSGRKSNTVITNDTEAIDQAIDRHGWYGLVLGSGEATYNDDDRTFQRWHEEIKGNPSAYQKRMRAAGARSRRRKICFVLSDVRFICLDAAALEECGRLHRQGRNSDGNPRRPKYSVNMTKVPPGSLLAAKRWD